MISFNKSVHQPSLPSSFLNLSPILVYVLFGAATQQLSSSCSHAASDFLPQSSVTDFMVSQRANTTIIIVIIGIDNHHNASLRAPLPPCPTILDSTTATPVWCHYSVVFVATNCCRCRRTPNGNAAVNSEWMAWEGSRSPIYYVYGVVGIR